MSVFLIVIICILVIFLLFETELKPPVSSMSLFELQRRAGFDHRYKQELTRRHYRAEILSWLRIENMLVLFLISALLVVTCGWLWGIIIALLIIGFHGSIARLTMRSFAQKQYTRFEPRLLRVIEKLPFAFRLIRSSVDESFLELSSREELIYLIENAGEVLTHDERQVIVGGLTLNERTVDEIMTTIDNIVTVKKTEFLGPLTLDELHKSGHSRVPVISTDINHIIGILSISTLLALEDKKSVTAEKAMNSKVVYIRDNHSLEQALRMMTRSHQHLLIVVDGGDQTVGIVTLNDILGALFGRSFDDVE